MLAVTTLMTTSISVVSAETITQEQLQEKAISSEMTESEVLGVSTRRRGNTSFVDDVNKKIKLLQRQLDEYDPVVQNLILIALIIILSALALRTELRFQELADKYNTLKKKRSLNPFSKKKTQKQDEN